MTITDCELAAFKLSRCGDEQCIFGTQGTSDTDTGCRCLTQRSDADAIKFMRAASLALHIAAGRERLSKRETELLRMLATADSAKLDMRP